MNQAITITFGDQAENHVGMQQIGELASHGFTLDEFKTAKAQLKEIGCESKIIHLNKVLPKDTVADDAYVMIIKDGVNKILNNNSKADLLYREQASLNTDKKAFMYGRVVNKHARHNLCFADFSQEPDYEHGLGRVIKFDDVPITNKIRTTLPKYFGPKASKLQAEGNYYYDTKKTGIGFHGDSERRIVIAVRLGEKIPLVYQWFYNSEPIGDKINLDISHGDIYIMSEKAVGTDWKRKTIYTLRHAAGSSKFTNL
jgi:hypothetical protein